MQELPRNKHCTNAAIHFIAGFGVMAALQLIIAAQSIDTPALFESNAYKSRLYALAMASTSAFLLDSKAGTLGVLMAAGLLEALSTSMPGSPPQARLAAASTISRSGVIFAGLLMPVAAKIDAMTTPAP